VYSRVKTAENIEPMSGSQGSQVFLTHMEITYQIMEALRKYVSIALLLYYSAATKLQLNGIFVNCSE